jgi:hypothetical protein
VLGGVFINYRRDDSRGSAGRIYDRLVSSLGPEKVFFDVDSIPPGGDFVEALSESLGVCDALVAVIGLFWASSLDEDKQRRLDDPKDFVRVEIEAALSRNIPVIPVLVDGARMPKTGELPDSLKMLTRRQGIEISHTRFDSDVDRLTRALSALGNELRQRRAVEAERSAREELEQREAAEAAVKVEQARTEAARRAEEAEKAKRARQVAEAETQRATQERHTQEAAEAKRAAREEREKGEGAETAEKAERVRRWAEAEAQRTIEEGRAAEAADAERAAIRPRTLAEKHAATIGELRAARAFETAIDARTAREAREAGVPSPARQLGPTESSRARLQRSSLADLPELVGFFSYSRSDNNDWEGELSALGEAIGRELALRLGRDRRNFHLWQEEIMNPGIDWKREIERRVQQAVFFIPIVTRRTVLSENWHFELDSFLARERALGRDDLVFPIYFIPVPELQDEAKSRNPALSIMAKRQFVDWTPFRHFPISDSAFGVEIERFCGFVAEALRKPSLTPG